MRMNIKRVLGCLFAVFFIISAVYSENAVVTFVKGKVEINRNNTWVPLKVGDKVNSSDTISTGFQSEAKVEYNGSVMHLGALTRITLENLSSSQSKDDVSVYLNTGAVRSKVTHTQNKRVSYSVKSPVAVASVRGTEFIVTAGGSVICKEGAVAVYANKDSLKKLSSASDAVEEEPEEEQKEQKTEEEAALDPKDAGPANSVTPAEKIDKTAPAGTVVVAANQEVVIKNNGNPETPMINAIKKTEKVVTSVTTPAVQEAVSVGGTSSVSTTAPTIIEAEPVKKAAGKLTATIVLKE